MKVAIMQPYFFPYIGYFQLIHAADVFVVYDDVNFMKGGWINRNFILTQNEKKRISLQLFGASPNKLINQVKVGNNQLKILKTIQQSYPRSSNYQDVIKLLETIFSSNETNLASFLNFSLRQVCDYIGIKRDWILSSELNKNDSLRGQLKVLEICKELGAEHYINVPGGKSLYDRESFEQMGVKLSFIEPNLRPYNQNSHEFIPALSIIDVLMNNNRLELNGLLNDYHLIKGGLLSK